MRRSLTSAWILLVTSWLVSPVGAATVLWQIGQKDGTYKDLAGAEKLTEYARSFPQEVTFTVGKDDPAQAWSAIHPGPDDHWASRREHPFRIRFELPDTPEGSYRLSVSLVDVHNFAPPELKLSINGREAAIPLESGAGDVSMLDPARGKHQEVGFVLPADHLRKGTNEMELRAIRGSWLIYDAIEFAAAPDAEQVQVQVRTRPTIFFVERDGRPLQEFEVFGSGLFTDQEAVIDVNAGVDRLAQATLGKPGMGIASGVVHVPAAAQPRQLTFQIAAGKRTATTSLTQEPQKTWHIFVAPATHTDIGYTDQQERVIDLHNRNTDLALELIQEFPLYHWNLESSWAAQMWFRDRPGYRHQELYQASRDHRLGIESSYLNMLTGLCSEEELIRNMYYSARLNREEQVPFESHTITDAPSHVWSVPSILAGARMRYLSVGINSVRAPVLRKEIHHKSPFWWEGPDGGRVLTWFTHGYAQASRIGLNEGIDRMRTAIGNDLKWWNGRRDYPYDAILLHGAYSDNVAIGRRIAESVTAYNEKYAFPKVILCANNDFFEHIEKHFAGDIPVVRGGGGSWWEDGAASSAVETGINRNAHQVIIAAESAWALASRLTGGEYPKQQLDRAWDNILLYDEHTWGAHNSMTAPTSDFVQRQFAVKAQYADDALRAATRVLQNGLRVIAANIDAKNGNVVVFNPSGRKRSGRVEVRIPKGSVIMDDGAPVSQQVIASDALRDDDFAFYAKDVPAMGYRVFTVTGAAVSVKSPPQRVNGAVLENDGYRVELDPGTGAVMSLVDKRLGTELVDKASPWKLGQLIYAEGGGQDGKTQIECPNRALVKYLTSSNVTIEPGISGALASSIRAKFQAPRMPHAELEVILPEDEHRVDFVFRLDKQMTYDKEAVYFAFPIAGDHPRFRYEIGGASMRPNEDQFPGACRDWFAVQRWVTVHTDDVAVVWSAVDTPLISLCDMNPGKWLEELPITNGTIFAYAMNNYWFTNYKAGQDGRMAFRYSLSSDKAKDITAITASAFGEAVMAPMAAMVVAQQASDPKLPATASFCAVEPPHVMLTTCKPADDGKGLIVRLRETSGLDTQARIRVGFKEVRTATRCDLVERNLEPVKITDGEITLAIKGNGMVAVRLE